MRMHITCLPACSTLLVVTAGAATVVGQRACTPWCTSPQHASGWSGFGQPSLRTCPRAGTRHVCTSIYDPQCMPKGADPSLPCTEWNW